MCRHKLKKNPKHLKWKLEMKKMAFLIRQSEGKHLRSLNCRLLRAILFKKQGFFTLELIHWAEYVLYL